MLSGLKMQTQLFQNQSWLRRKPNACSPLHPLTQQLCKVLYLDKLRLKITLPQAGLHLNPIPAALAGAAISSLGQGFTSLDGEYLSIHLPTSCGGKLCSPPT